MSATNARRPRAAWSLLLVALLAVACSKAASRAEPSGAATPAVVQGGDRGLPAADRAMRITIETSIEVADVAAAASAVRAAVARAGGYVGEARAQGSEGARFASIEAHVPVAALPAFRAEAGKLGDVVSETEKAEDVTEQRADIKARLGNARAAEKRLLELLDKRAGTLADVVAVEKELASARETIERMEAQERVIEGQIALATVRVSISASEWSRSPGAGRRVARAASEGIHNAGAFVVGLAVFVASAGPTLLLVAAFGYGVFRAVRALVRRAQPRAR